MQRALRKLFRVLFNRNVLFILLLLLQIGVLVLTVLFLSQHYLLVYSALVLLNAVLVVCICNSPENPSYKMPWLAAMLIVPLFAGLAYLLVKTDAGQRLLKQNYTRQVHSSRQYLPEDAAVCAQFQQQYPDYAGLSNYLLHSGGFPLYRNHISAYYAEGETMFEAMKDAVRKAKRYVFLEFFIIAQGNMWQELLTILQERAAAGVEVRVLYDGFGTQFLMPGKYFANLEQSGIHCKVFNAFKPFLSSSQNTRDHRKILVVDGVTAFTGGINIADEYINCKPRFGHWKDGGMLCRGEAAWSFAAMFLQLWDEPDWTQYLPAGDRYPLSDGFIQPYCDAPTDREYVGRCVYLDIIHQAKNYVYIMTPYLLPDNELVTALGLAAKKGVDVRIMMPHIPDKWYAYSAAWSYYSELLGEQVRIFEYTPGFLHAKNICSDDRIAVVGTINFDYRSLYLHFECAAVLYGSSTVQSVRRDFADTLLHCIEIRPEDCRNRPPGKRVLSWIMRMFAPLL